MNPPHSPDGGQNVLPEDVFGQAFQSIWNQSALSRQVLWVALVALPAVWLWNAFFPGKLRPNNQQRVGLCIFVLGYCLRAWAKASLGAGFTYVISEPRSPTLVTSGPYAMLVHPSYTGALLSYGLGMVLTLRLPLILSAPIFVVMCSVVYVARVLPEEDVLRGHFGSEAFDAFAATRCTLIPFVF